MSIFLCPQSSFQTKPVMVRSKAWQSTAYFMYSLLFLFWWGLFFGFVLFCCCLFLNHCNCLCLLYLHSLKTYPHTKLQQNAQHAHFCLLLVQRQLQTWKSLYLLSLNTLKTCQAIKTRKKFNIFQWLPLQYPVKLVTLQFLHFTVSFLFKSMQKMKSYYLHVKPQLSTSFF